MSKRDYYDVLGVERTAGPDELKRSYRKLALKLHPDRNPDDPEAERRFKEAAEAYQVLSDEEKRSRYDRYGHDGLDGVGVGNFSSFGDIFSAFGDVFGEGGGLFGNLFGGGGGGPRRGPDLHARIHLTFEEMAKGVEKTVELSRREICETCDGSGSKPGVSPVTCTTCRGYGQVQQAQAFFSIRTVCPQCRGAGQLIVDPCADCRGEGRVVRPREITVRVPAGIDDGARLRLAGEGETGDDGAARGDLLCEVRVSKHPFLERHGRDLIVVMPIGVAQAALGAPVQVPTLDGQKSLKVPSGTQSGDVRTMAGLGLPDPRGYGCGDLHVRLLVEIPRKLTARQRELLRELAETEEQNVSPERKSFFDKVKEYFSK